MHVVLYRGTGEFRGHNTGHAFAPLTPREWVGRFLDALYNALFSWALALAVFEKNANLYSTLFSIDVRERSGGVTPRNRLRR